MGLTVLYIAFGFVALWLLAEVLLQNKARLRWRLLAFAGFSGVVAGVLLPSVIVIGVGAAAFAVGQTLVTLSFRRGFEAGWALRRRSGAKGGKPGKGAKGGKGTGGKKKPARREPALEVSGLEYGPGEPAAAGDPSGPADTAVFAAVDADPAAGTGSWEPEGQPAFADAGAPQGGYQYSGYYDPQGRESPEPYADSPYAASYEGGYAEQQYPQQGGYDYGTGPQPVHPGYQDPYPGTDGQGHPYAAQHDGYLGAGQETYANHQDPYTSHQYAMDTPPGGVWVPQQRDVHQPQAQPYGQQPAAEGEQAYPYQGTGEYEQYRY
ncbi:hypothetical protein [Streptomyces sp. NPDC097619]|uniref:hypothetical protein n=1 Tax=Streptomyces sp. NPDC097619 TaxID=3157228 RepID=UPI00332243B0